MRFVVFGLSVSSAWGNGHATLWRGLVKALSRLGHSVSFCEWNAPYYRAHRDYHEIPGGTLRLYDRWDDMRDACALLSNADVAIVTSHCPHGRAASELIFDSRVPLKVFYDLDTPITLHRLERGEQVEYLGPRGLADFDLVLSFTGGRALRELRRRLFARRVEPLYGCVDPDVHAPTPPVAAYRADLSYLGTFASERQSSVERLLLEPARRCPEHAFVLAGSQYPESLAIPSNMKHFHHVTPAEHAAFYCSCRLNLNLTRAPMAELGYCPSARLFEAAACGAVILSDAWEGMNLFYTPDQEILTAQTTEDVIAALSLGDEELLRMGQRARERTLDEHTAERRARELLSYLYDTSNEKLSASEPTPFGHTAREA